MRTSLMRWIKQQLSHPKAEGGGRNNQMISLAPRLMELGWSEQKIFACFKRIYGLGMDSSKDREIYNVIQNARKYARQRRHSEQMRSVNATVKQRSKTTQALEAYLPNIFTRFAWCLGEVRDLGWCDLHPTEQRRKFLAALFLPEEIVWSGTKYSSGKPHHIKHFRPVRDWISLLGAYPFISHCTFKTGTFSRSNDAVLLRKYLVLESDNLTHDQTLSVFNWLGSEGGLNLRAVVSSGNKSIHGWFDWPSNDYDEIKAVIEGLSCDPATMRPSQPVRLAGALRRETGRIQELLYLA
ncbi:MAG: hypothetical protein QM796_20660 [Chthoniobacteraceae bacterium]